MRFDEKNLFQNQEDERKVEGSEKIKSLTQMVSTPHPGHRTNISKLPNKLPLSSSSHLPSFLQTKQSKQTEP